MVDVRAPLRVIDEFLWMLRRSGMAVATARNTVERSKLAPLLLMGSPAVT